MPIGARPDHPLRFDRSPSQGRQHNHTTHKKAAMKIKQLAVFALAGAMFAACTDTTDTIGNSLTDTTDRLDIQTDTFEVSTRSIAVDSVLSRSIYTYLGHIKDTETGTYVTSNYTTQFTILENIYGNSEYLPAQDSIVSRKDGQVVADSCRLRIFVKSYEGDSLNPMKLAVCEMATPVEEGQSYYTNFNPEARGMLRTDGKQIRKNKAYTVMDLNLSDSLRNSISSNGSAKPITISLDDEYTDTNGQKYDNYGTYIMRKFYENKAYFKNSYSFAHNVCPGFYIKSTDGLGVICEVYMTELQVYYRYTEMDSTVNGMIRLSGTEEVMQTNTIVNDKERTKQLAEDPTCTYIKAPAGIFTEVTLPIEEIAYGHENDTLSSAKVVFTRLNPTNDDNSFGEPTSVMIMPKDSLYSFFENKNLPDNMQTYLATYDNTRNTYAFNNIAGLVLAMYKAKRDGKSTTDSWNKAVLVPVAVTTNTSSSSTTITNVSNEMALKSTKLVGGADNPHKKIEISVVYNKFVKQ